MAASDAVAADVMDRAFGAGGAALMSAVIMVAALTSANATAITGARTDRMRGRLRHLHQPGPQGPDGGERPCPVVRVGQPPQGRGAQRGADRRASRPPPSEEGVRTATVRPSPE